MILQLATVRDHVWFAKANATIVNGADTPDTIKSAKQRATNNGFRKRVGVWVHNVITSEALPNTPPKTTMQYNITKSTTGPESNQLVVWCTVRSSSLLL